MTQQPAAIIPIMTYRCQNNLNLSLLFLWSAQASPMRGAALGCGDQGLEIHCRRRAASDADRIPTVSLGIPPYPHPLPHPSIVSPNTTGKRMWSSFLLEENPPSTEGMVSHEDRHNDPGTALFRSIPNLYLVLLLSRHPGPAPVLPAWQRMRVTQPKPDFRCLQALRFSAHRPSLPPTQKYQL